RFPPGLDKEHGINPVLPLKRVRSPSLPPSRPGGCQTGFGTLLDEAALQLCNGRHEDKEELPHGGGGINIVLQTLEPNVPLLQVCHEVDEPLRGASEAI